MPLYVTGLTQIIRDTDHTGSRWYNSNQWKGIEKEEQRTFDKIVKKSQRAFTKNCNELIRAKVSCVLWKIQTCVRTPRSTAITNKITKT